MSFEEKLLDRVADAIARTVYAPAEMPLDPHVEARFRGMARAAVKATLAELRDVVVAHKIGTPR